MRTRKEKGKRKSKKKEQKERTTRETLLPKGFSLVTSFYMPSKVRAFPPRIMLLSSALTGRPSMNCRVSS